MKIVGSSCPIHDARAKATGRAVYAGDMQLQGMLHVAVLFSPIPHGLVKSVDASAALALPGVVDVIHCLEITHNVYNRYRNMAGDDPLPQERVFNDHVRFIGDRVGCVVAETPELAKRALDLVKVEYEELPYSTDMQEVRTTGILDNLHEDGAIYGDFTGVVGNPGDAAPDAVETSTTSYISRVNHVTMEPHACVASYDKTLEELTVWCPNQSVHGIRSVLCDLLELPYHKVRVVKTTMGGSFGAKQEWMLEPVCAVAAMRTGRPVKLVFSRKDAMASTICRCPIDAKFTSRITRDGKIQGFEADFTLDAGAYLGNSYDYAVAVLGKFYRVYSYPYVKYTGRAVCTNSPVSGAFRGWATPELYIVLEHNLNMAARKLGIDPLELRLRNVAMPGDIDAKSGEPLGAIRAKECIERGRELFRWDEKKTAARAFNEMNSRYRRGVGIACGGHVNGYFPRRQDFAGVDMRMTESGGVQVNITIHDHGCGSVTAFKMMVAEALDLSIDDIAVREGDTAFTPLDVGCFASRTVYVLGRAAVDCAEKLRRALLQNVAELHKVGVEELYTEAGCVLSRADKGFRLTYGEAALASVRELQREVVAAHQYVNTTNPGVAAAHLAHVEVDTYTGMTKILDYVAVHDIGRVINREICVAQVQGAVLMGAGAAIAEHADMKPGGKPTCSLKDYHLINAFETPPILVDFIEDGGTEGPYGAKSIGEVSHVPVAPAVVGAVNDALGSGLCHLPLTPDRIVKLMQQRRSANETAI